MTDATWQATIRRSVKGTIAFASPRMPFLLTFACLLMLNWGTAFWLLRYTFQERQGTAFQLAGNELKFAEQKLSGLIRDADRTLLELRAQYPGSARPDNPAQNPAVPFDLGGWTPASNTGGIALIAPDGHVVTSSPNASSAGWPRLMARLATSADVLAIGDPTISKTGHLGFIPIARRIVEPDGSFGGILMYSLESETFPNLSPAAIALDGCLSLISDDGIVLARRPDLRGTVGIRIAVPSHARWVNGGPIVNGHVTSPIDGVDRIFSRHHMDGIPATVVVGLGYDATFADWMTLRTIVLVTRMGATALILLAAWLWYTRRHRARISADALETILASIDHGIRVEGADGKVIAANAAGAALRLPDSPKDELPDATGHVTGLVEMRREDGTPIAVRRHDLASGGMVLIGTDLTARGRAEARIDFLLRHDPLTRLPNRWNAAARLREMIAERANIPRIAALILLDLDGFQAINDTLGHDGGDEVLIEVARRLRGLVAKHDVVARLGGDEFLLCLDDPDDEAAVMGLARQIPRAIARAITVRGHQIHLGLSLGIALYPRDAGDATNLFRAADIALNRAKLAGRGTAQRFEPEMMATFEESRMLESDLRHALDCDQLEFRLQPQFCANRWR